MKQQRKNGHMRIAAATDKNDVRGTIGQIFGAPGMLIFIDIDDNTLEIADVMCIEMPAQAAQAANRIVEENCEALISGTMDDETFELLAENQVTRYNGAGLVVLDAVEKMHSGMLSFFTHTQNEEGCGSTHAGQGEKHGYK
jgi:predicted Fe-Mo cluster-binding NifX family protein